MAEELDFSGDVGDVEGLEEGEIALDAPIVLDLGAVRDEPVSPGWHTVKIERAEAGISNQKKIPKIFILSRIIDEGDEDYNRTLIWNVMLQGDGLIFTKRCFKALGFPSVLDYASLEDLCAELIDLEVDVQTRHRVYKQEKQSNVSNWRPVRQLAY